MAFMLNQNLPYWQQQQAVQANMKAAEDASRAASDAREAVTGMSVAINRQPSANSTNPGIGAIVPYTPPVFDPRLGGLAVESCQKNGGYCGDTEGIAREAIAKATTADKLAYDKSVADKVAANFARSSARFGRDTRANPSNDPVIAAVQAAGAVPDARATHIAGLISGAVANGQCFSGAQSEVLNSAVCKSHRDIVFANKAKGMTTAQAVQAALNPTTPKEVGTKVDAALKKHKADVAKVKKSVSKLKEKAKNKKSFAKGIAKMKKNRGR